MKKFLVICGLLLLTPVFANVYYFDGNGNSTFGEGEAYTNGSQIKIIKPEKKKKVDKTKEKSSVKSESSANTEDTTPKKSTKKKSKKRKKLKAV